VDDDRRQPELSATLPNCLELQIGQDREPIEVHSITRASNSLLVQSSSELLDLFEGGDKSNSQRDGNTERQGGA
jgi:hypothetical protein